MYIVYKSGLYVQSQGHRLTETVLKNLRIVPNPVLDFNSYHLAQVSNIIRRCVLYMNLAGLYVILRSYYAQRSKYLSKALTSIKYPLTNIDYYPHA